MSGMVVGQLPNDLIEKVYDCLADSTKYIGADRRTWKRVTIIIDIENMIDEGNHRVVVPHEANELPPADLIISPGGKAKR